MFTTWCNTFLYILIILQIFVASKHKRIWIDPLFSHRTPFCQFGAEWEKGACKLGARRELTGSYKGLKLFLAAAKRSFGGR